MHITRSMGFIQILTGLLLLVFAGLLLVLPQAVQFAPVVYDYIGIPDDIPNREEQQRVAEMIQSEFLPSPDQLADVAAIPNPALTLQIRLMWEGIRAIALVLVFALAILLLTQGVANVRHGIDESQTSKTGRGFQLAISLLTLYLLIQSLTGSLGFAIVGVVLAFAIFGASIFFYQKKYSDSNQEVGNETAKKQKEAKKKDKNE